MVEVNSQQGGRRHAAAKIERLSPDAGGNMCNDESALTDERARLDEPDETVGVGRKRQEAHPTAGNGRRHSAAAELEVMLELTRCLRGQHRRALSSATASVIDDENPRCVDMPTVGAPMRACASAQTSRAFGIATCCDTRGDRDAKGRRKRCGAASRACVGDQDEIGQDKRAASVTRMGSVKATVPVAPTRSSSPTRLWTPAQTAKVGER